MSLVLGLDISPRAVRGAFLRTRFRGREMEHYAEAAVPYATESESEQELLRAAVAQVLSAGARTPDRVIAALGGDEASLRLIDLPIGVEKRAAEVLPGELEPLLPFDVEDAVVDYQIVSRDESKVELMAVAVPRHNVSACLKRLQDLGVDPRELAVGAVVFEGLGALVSAPFEDRTVLVIDVGPTSTDFAALTDGQCTFARTVSGGMDLVESGRRTLLGASLQHTLASYRAQRSQEPSLVLLAGETSSMDGARQWMAEQLGIECGVAPLPAAPGADPETLPKFAKAASLAARAISRRRQIDLRQGEFASKAAAGEIRKHLRLLAIAATAILLSFGVSLGARYRVARAEHDRLSAVLSEVSQDLLGQEARSAMHARELLTMGPRVEDPLPRFDAYDVLEAISGSIPEDIQHDTRRLLIEIDDEGDTGRFEMQGTLGTIAERDRLSDALQEHRCFGEVDKGSVSTAVEDRMDYKIEVKIRCEEPSSREKEK